MEPDFVFEEKNLYLNGKGPERVALEFPPFRKTSNAQYSIRLEYVTNSTPYNLLLKFKEHFRIGRERPKFGIDNFL